MHEAVQGHNDSHGSQQGATEMLSFYQDVAPAPTKYTRSLLHAIGCSKECVDI